MKLEEELTTALAEERKTRGKASEAEPFVTFWPFDFMQLTFLTPLTSLLVAL